MPNASLQKYKYKIYKYTNTAYDEVPEGPNMWYIFEKRIVQGYQKLYFHVPNAHVSTPDHYPRSLPPITTPDFIKVIRGNYQG